MLDKTVNLGIRPENLSLDQMMFEAFPHAVIPGFVKISELMGADRYLYIDIGSHNLLAVRVNPRFAYDEDEPIKIAADMDKALFFDPDTEERIAD